jgi:hypothetical protein
MALDKLTALLGMIACSKRSVFCRWSDTDPDWCKHGGPKPQRIIGFGEEPLSSALAFRLGDSLLLLEKDSGGTVDPNRQARRWQYITLQVTEIDVLRTSSCGALNGLIAASSLR